MRGRGASGVAATVAASVASKVNGGSLFKVTDDPTKDKGKDKSPSNDKDKVETRKVPEETKEKESARPTASRWGKLGGTFVSEKVVFLCSTSPAVGQEVS